MICSEFFELLDNYETLTDEQRIEMEKHTAECETCRKELEFFKSVMSNLASIPSPKAPKSLIDNVNAKLDAQKTTVIGFNWNFRALSTVAACLAIGLVVGINNGYIKETITGNGTDGVISETKVEEPQSTSQATEPVETIVAEPEIEEVKPAGNVKLPAETEASKPVVVAQRAERPKVPVVKTQQPTKPTETAVKEVVTPTVAPQKDESKPGKTEEIPVQTTAPVPTPDNASDVEDYQIKDDGPQIAYGKYNVEVTKKAPNTFSDYLHVESNDMGAVVSTMSEMGVKNSGGYYMTSRDNFYALMDRLNDQGVGYECDLQYNSGDAISFRLTYN